MDRRADRDGILDGACDKASDQSMVFVFKSFPFDAAEYGVSYCVDDLIWTIGRLWVAYLV